MLASGVDWGNVPTWVGALLTSGTLMLGLVLFFRNTRRDKRELADAVSYWRVYEQHMFKSMGFVNAGDRPITSVRLLSIPRRPSRLRRYLEDITLLKYKQADLKYPFPLRIAEVPVLRAHDEVVLTLNRDENDDQLQHQVLWLCFTDGRNVYWERNLETGALERPSTEDEGSLAVVLGQIVVTLSWLLPALIALSVARIAWFLPSRVLRVVRKRKASSASR